MIESTVTVKLKPILTPNYVLIEMGIIYLTPR